MSTSAARRAFGANPFAAAVATAFGAGLSPVAPGTAGSALALGVGWLLHSHAGILGSPVGLLMSGLAVAAAGVAVTDPVCRALESDDPGCIVIDEVAGQLIACAGAALVPGGPFWAFAAAFVLFRFFDVVKPLGIGRLQALPGGWGIVADDVAGGAAAGILLAIAAIWL